MKRNCERCGKEFEANHKGRKNCSMECYRPPIELKDRLLKCLTIQVNGCWEWSGWKDKDGYGAFNVYDSHTKRTKFNRVNRAVYELFKGPIEPGLMVCHRCDNPACFRPSHLFKGTSLDNNRDMINKGRNGQLRGEQKSQSILTENDVRRIRSMHASGQYTQRHIAKEFGIGYKAICKIVHRQRWAHVQ